jgi:methanogenic corrinoid protein MtbC1
MLDSEKLRNALADLEEDTVYEILNEVMAGNRDGAPAALAACQEGMGIVGDRFETGEYFVTDLIFAGELMETAMGIIRPALASGSSQKIAKMVICTVEGDLHDIGKNIVKAIMEASGFDVIDLGIDTSVQKIVDTVKSEDIKILGLSGVLTLAIDAMKKTVQALIDANIRDKVRIIIGGAPITEDIREYVGADAWAINPQTAVDICRTWVV